MMVVTSLMVIVFIFGFAKVMTITGGSPSGIQDQELVSSESLNQESATKANGGDRDDNQVILTIGDSIGAGVGDERNMGIAQRYVTMQAYEIRDYYEVINYAVPGAETSDLMGQVTSGEMDEAIVASDLVIVSIGGNNLNRIRNAEATMQLVEFEEKLGLHLRDLDLVLKYIRDKNSDAEIVVLGLYNPYGRDSDNEDIRLLQEWNYQTRLLVMTMENVDIVPLYDVFKNNLPLLLSIDAFHPSGEGYERIAAMIDELMPAK